MHKLIVITALFACCLASCRVFTSLNSTTQIESSKSFVLGEGKHGSYNANVKNVSNNDIEVFKSVENGPLVSLGLLKPREKKQYNVPKNTKVIFKNLDRGQANIQIKLVGDTNLSMGYQNNEATTASETKADKSSVEEVKEASEATDLTYIKIKVASKSLTKKSYTVRGPAEKAFSFGIEVSSVSHFEDTMPIGTRIESTNGKVLHTVSEADRGQVIRVE